MVIRKWKVESGRYRGKDVHRLNLMTITFLFFLFTSCGKINSTQTSLDIENTKTPTILVETTLTPNIFLTFTPLPTTHAQATISSFDSLCIGAKEVYKPEISPNGEWLAAQCYSENDSEDSPLQVSRLDGSKTWKIYYIQYNKDEYPIYRDDGILPYRWSQDGKYLYAFTGQRLSGCCWIGGRYVLLIRLNLETGEQILLLDADFGYTFDFIISESDRYLIFTPPSNQPYDFAILDMKTWETKQFFEKFPYYIDIYYAVMSPSEDKIILPLFQNLEFDFYYVDAIAMIDLVTGEQKIIISDLKDGEELYPIKWNSGIEVVVASAPPHTLYYQEEVKFWLLNINTGELQETEKPK